MPWTKSLLAAAVVGASLSAQAAIGPVGPGDLGLITTDTATLVNAIAGTNTDINDSYTFSLSGLSNIAAAFADFTPPNTNAGEFSTNLAGFAIFSTSSATPLLFDNTPGDGLLVAGQLGAGSYVLTVLGTTTGTLGGAYAGGLAVAAVPEPATYLMMALGMAALGGWSMRQRRGR